MKDRVPSEQRVFSLVLALVASPQGLTRAQLLSTVYGYSDRARASSSAVAIERMFERDKEQMRHLGIPIETLDSPLEPGNNQLTRYRISKERLQRPDGLDFTANEVTVLRLAALAWSEGSLGDQSRWASMKLASFGAHVDSKHLGIAPRLSIAHQSAGALHRAIEDRLVVSFDYQLAGNDSPQRRSVAPLRLHRADGRWHLLARDLIRDADRVFLLSRITSDVSVSRETFDISFFDSADRMIEELKAIALTQRALVAVTKGSVAEARLAPRALKLEHFDGCQQIQISTLDYHEFAREIASYGEEAAVIEPVSLRDEVSKLLTEMREQHSG